MGINFQVISPIDRRKRKKRTTDIGISSVDNGNFSFICDLLLICVLIQELHFQQTFLARIHPTLHQPCVELFFSLKAIAPTDFDAIRAVLAIAPKFVGAIRADFAIAPKCHGAL